MKATLITPVFNGKKHLRATINSVLAQCQQDWEWIIVDDGSTDGTAELLDRIEDNRIVVVHQNNAGVSAARNAGLDRARGDYVTFLDADDTLPPNALALRCAVLDANSDVDIVHGSVRIISDALPERIQQPSLSRVPLLHPLARLDPTVFFGVNYMVRRDRIGTVRFPRHVTHCEDLLFFLSLAHNARLNYAAVPDVIYEYRVRAGSAMSNLDGLEAGYLELVRQCKELPRIDAATRAVQQSRVERILFRSWVRRFRLTRAIAAVRKVRKAAAIQVSA